jgi:hypothetical protein
MLIGFVAVAFSVRSLVIAQPQVPICVSDEDRVHIRAQVLAAVDDAFRDNIKHLFIGWLKDPRQQPERASAGMQASIGLPARACRCAEVVTDDCLGDKP